MRLIDELLADWASVGPQNPLLFFAGAGVSLAWPSILPSVPQVLEATLNATAPHPVNDADANALVDEKDALRRSILPESYYDILEGLVGLDLIRCWSVLDLWKQHQKLKRYALGPNVCHQAIAYLAWRSRTPILTVNFDGMFEEAARQLGLSPMVCTPPAMDAPHNDASHHRSSPWIIPQGRREVGVWKLHGSSSDTDTIRTTLVNISRADWRMLDALESLFTRENLRFLYVGYSGRDLDLFPFMSQWIPAGRTYWISPSFWPGHPIDRLGNGCTPVSKKFEEIIPHSLQQELRSLIEAGGGREDSGVSSSSNVASNIEEDARSQYSDLVRSYVAKSVGESRHVVDPTAWRVVQALALLKVGEYQSAIRQFKFVDEGELHDLELAVRAWLVQASIWHQLSKYILSERCASEAYQLANQASDSALALEARLVRSEALRMQHLPRIGHNDGRTLRSGASWRTGVRLFWDGMIALWRRRKLRGTTMDNVRCEHEVIEHWVRIVGSMQGFLCGHVPGSRVIVNRAWDWLGREAYDSGYALGIGNVEKYRKRLKAVNGAIPMGEGPPDAFELLKETAGGLLVGLDEADDLWESGARRSACERYESLFWKAYLVGNWSLALKCLVHRRQRDKDFRARGDLVSELFDGIEGKGYERRREELYELLREVTTEVGE